MRRLGALLLGGVLALAACGGGSTSDTSDQGQGSLTVFAAASLRTTFTELGRSFEQQNAGTSVTFSFAGSSDLATQITNGAPADVFAAADEKNMAKLTDARLVDGAPVPFATNTLTIITPANNPAVVGSFADLARPGTSVVVCAPQVPCGAAAEKLEQLTGTTLQPVSEESSVADVVTKVTSGEADAGLVYVTDARDAGPSVQTVEVPEAAQAVNTYPIAVLTGGAQKQPARAFVDYVRGPAGQQVLRDAGFGSP